jgi:hypothetical protein
MSADCRAVQDLLAEGAALEAGTAAHVEACDACRCLRDALARQAAELAALQRPAPEHVAHATLVRVRATTQAAPGRNWLLAAARNRTLSAAAVIVLLAIVVPLLLWMVATPMDQRGGEARVVVAARGSESRTVPAAEPPPPRDEVDKAGRKAQRELNEKPDAYRRLAKELLDEERQLGREEGQAAAQLEEAEVAAGRHFVVDTKKTETSMSSSESFLAGAPSRNKRVEDVAPMSPGVVPAESAEGKDVSVGGGTAGQIGYRLNGASINGPVDGGALFDVPTAAIEDFKLVRSGFQQKYGEQSGPISEIVMGDRLDADGFIIDGVVDPALLASTAADWAHVTLDRPVYFENLYLGGNARLVYLDALADALGTGGLPPHRLACERAQPFDPPARGAMALHVDLDRAFMEPGEAAQRVFLQVGLKGADVAAWRPAPLSLAVVQLVGEPNASAARAAVDALVKGLDAQDRIALVASGQPVTFTAADRATAGTASAAEMAVDVARALRGLPAAYERAESRGSQRNRRLVLVTDAPLDDDARAAVQALGLDDIATSVISLEPSARAQHAGVALAGQGNLHLARTEQEAAEAARDELDLLTRIVARAVRVNIRLAPGVELVQVLGSRPLGKREVKAVKEAEKAVDRNVARTTGIAKDRGADDPGLQTVIPVFLAGDEHVILVELRVKGPGPVADVQLRCKDLVAMDNATLRASAALARQPQQPSPRQEQVLRNVLGHEVALALKAARLDVLDGEPDVAALQRLASRTDLATMAADAELVRQYVGLIQSDAPEEPLAASLECAAAARLGRGSCERSF